MAISSREYALVYRAGLSNEVRPFKLSFWDKSYNLAHGTLQIQNLEAHVALGHSNWKTGIHHKKVFAEKWVPTKKMPSRDGQAEKACGVDPILGTAFAFVGHMKGRFSSRHLSTLRIGPWASVKGGPKRLMITGQLRRDLRDMFALISRAIKLVGARLARAVGVGQRRGAIGRPAGDLVHVGQPRKGVWEAHDDHALVK
jgi:hypothetical protein